MNFFLYMKHESLNTEPICIPELFIPNSKTILNLERNTANYTDYPKYKTIAYKLLPSVFENPLFWKAVPQLCEVKQGLFFKDSLNAWMNVIDSHPVHAALSIVISSLLR